MKLIVGLGNPGKQYETTRHNLGFRAVDILAGKTKWQDSKKFKAQIAALPTPPVPRRGSGGGGVGAKILLAKPQTFMNDSGLAVRRIIDFYKIPLENILVIYDDIDLLLEETRFRNKGSSGGHNGMASIIEHLGTENIARLRLGVAPQMRGKQAIPAEDYVLAPFSPAGENKIKKTLAQVPELINNWLFP